MTPKRLVLLLVFLAAGFSTIFVLPTTARMQPAGVRLELPQFVGKWYGVDQAISERELEMLASDTEFARKLTPTRPETRSSSRSCFRARISTTAFIARNAACPPRVGRLRTPIPCASRSRPGEKIWP